MKQLGVRGVESGDQPQIEEMERDDRTVLHEPGSQRQVIPEGVGSRHAVVIRINGPRGPVGGDQGDCQHGHDVHGV